MSKTGLYIPIYLDLTGHPKFKKLCRMLGKEKPYVIGCLVSLWSWVMKYYPDGIIDDSIPEDIADECFWDGDSEVFVNALINSGFIEIVDEVYQVHNWDRYGGRLLYRVEQEKQRSKNRRDRVTTDEQPCDDRVTTGGQPQNDRVTTAKRPRDDRRSTGGQPQNDRVTTGGQPQNDRVIPSEKPPREVEVEVEVEEEVFKADSSASSFEDDETDIFAPEDPVFLKIPCKGNSKKNQPSEYPLRESQVRAWEAEEGFEDLDVRALIRRAREWCIQAPNRRKMHDHIPHWIYSVWLCKAKDKGEYPKRASPDSQVVSKPVDNIRDRFVAELDRLIGKEESQAWFCPEDSIRDGPDDVKILVQSKFRMNYIEKQFFKQFESAARAAVGKELMPVSLAIGWIEKMAKTA